MTDPMVALYSIVEAVADRKIVEGEIIIVNTSGDEEQRIEIMVRSEVKHYNVTSMGE